MKTVGIRKLAPTGLTPVEWIWVDDLYFVQAVSDSSGKVIRWSVTSRSKKFRPEFRSPSGSLVVRLHRTTLADLPLDSLQRINLCLAAHHYWYFDSYYFGNPDNYQTFHVGMSMAAVGDMDIDTFVDLSNRVLVPAGGSEVWVELGQDHSLRREQVFLDFRRTCRPKIGRAHV
jgi:hypothetical protein